MRPFFCVALLLFLGGISLFYVERSFADQIYFISKVDTTKPKIKDDKKRKEFYKRYNGDNGSSFYFFRSCNRWRRSCGYKHGWGNFWWRRCMRRHGCYLHY